MRAPPAALAALVALAPAGCIIGNLFRNAGRNDAMRPAYLDRCANWKEPLSRRGCEKLRERARVQVETLRVGDAVCLDPPLGDAEGECRARGQIDDQDTTAFRVRVLEASPQSRWSTQADGHFWMENLTLIDLYLQERGF